VQALSAEAKREMLLICNNISPLPWFTRGPSVKKEPGGLF